MSASRRSRAAILRSPKRCLGDTNSCALGLVSIPLRVPQSQYVLLEALCRITNQSLPEQLALLLADLVMPSVEAAVHEHQTTTDQPTPSTIESQLVPPLNRGEQLRPTPPRPVIPPSAKPPSGDSERLVLATDLTPKSPHANEFQALL